MSISKDVQALWYGYYLLPETENTKISNSLLSVVLCALPAFESVGSCTTNFKYQPDSLIWPIHNVYIKRTFQFVPRIKVLSHTPRACIWLDTDV